MWIGGTQVNQVVKVVYIVQGGFVLTLECGSNLFNPDNSHTMPSIHVP